MKQRIWLTFFNGLLLFLPIFVVLVIVAQSVQTLRPVVEPLVAALPVESRLGALIVIGLCLGMLILIIFLFGVFAQLTGLAHKLGALDQGLSRTVPGYSLLKSTLKGATGQADETDGFVPVVAVYSGAGRLGFQVDRLSGDRIVVFLPDVPNRRTGETVILPAEAVEALNISPHKLSEILSFHGRGLEPSPAPAPKTEKTAHD